MVKKLKFSDTFKECYKKLPENIQKKVDKQLRFLRNNPNHPSLNIHPVQGTGGIWEGYVDFSYRFTFEIRDDHYYLRVVGPHKVIDTEARKKPDQ
jgi:mRNA-degrading endonuclease RelE of RelBE toxin-antitoxin system